jgi:hypothetical protein
MGALVESGLAYLRAPDVDAAGYFQARMGIWNRGEYAGYPDNPPLQLKWFLDQAAIVRRAQIAAGAPDPVLDERRWGNWIADVLVPAENFRFRYQLRLAEARTLVGAPCTPPAAGQPPLPAPVPSSPSSVDRTAPALRVSGARRQRGAGQRDRPGRGLRRRAVRDLRGGDDRAAATAAGAGDHAAPARPAGRRHRSAALRSR